MNDPLVIAALYISFGFAVTWLLNDSGEFDGFPYPVKLLLRILTITAWLPIAALFFLRLCCFEYHFQTVGGK